MLFYSRGLSEHDLLDITSVEKSLKFWPDAQEFNKPLPFLKDCHLLLVDHRRAEWQKLLWVFVLFRDKSHFLSEGAFRFPVFQDKSRET